MYLITFSSAGAELCDSIPVRFSKVVTISWENVYEISWHKSLYKVQRMASIKVSYQAMIKDLLHLRDRFVQTVLLSWQQPAAVQGSALHLEWQMIKAFHQHSYKGNFGSSFFLLQTIQHTCCEDDLTRVAWRLAQMSFLWTELTSNLVAWNKRNGFW